MADNILSKDKPCEIELPDADAILCLSYHTKAGSGSPGKGQEKHEHFSGDRQTLKERLINILLSVTGVNEPNSDERNFLLDDLPKDPVHHLKRHDHPRIDLNRMVTEVMKWGWLDNGELAIVVLIKNALNIARGTQQGRELDKILNELQIGYRERLSFENAETEA